MGCNLIFTQFCWLATEFVHTVAVHVVLTCHWKPGREWSGTSKWSKATGATQRHEPSACLPGTLPPDPGQDRRPGSRQWSLCSVLGLSGHHFDRRFICQEAGLRWFPGILRGNPRLSVKGAWMRLNSDLVESGLVKQETRICRQAMAMELFPRSEVSEADCHPASLPLECPWASQEGPLTALGGGCIFF